MKANIFLYFLGPAGAGKSTMTGAFQSWMFRQGYDAVTVNLDPGGINLPYEVDVDIRDWVRLEDVMDEYGLGPNGAQVVASDMMVMHSHDIRESLEGFSTDYFLVDSPGQIELFSSRDTSREIMMDIALGPALVVYLFEPLLASTPQGMISQLTQAATVKYRLGMPFIQVLNKVDLLDEKTRERTLSWSDPDVLYDDLIREQGSMIVEFGMEQFRALEGTGEAARMLPCSAASVEGLEDIYSAVQTLTMGGEDLDTQ